MKKIRSLCILFVMGGICLFPSRLYGRGTSGDEGDARVNVKLNGLALIGISSIQLWNFGCLTEERCNWKALAFLSLRISGHG